MRLLTIQSDMDEKSFGDNGSKPDKQNNQNNTGRTENEILADISVLLQELGFQDEAAWYITRYITYLASSFHAFDQGIGNYRDIHDMIEALEDSLRQRSWAIPFPCILLGLWMSTNELIDHIEFDNVIEGDPREE